MDESDSTKRCTKCEETKPLSGFPRDRRRKLGVGSWCRACLYAANRRNAKARPEAQREYQRRYREKNLGRGTKNPGHQKAERQGNAGFYERHGHPRIIVSEKLCGGCGEVKPAQAFGVAKRNPNGLNERCKECRAEEFRRYRQKNPEANGLYGKRWREKNPQNERARKMRRRTREAGAIGEWTHEQERALYDFYEHACLACGWKGKMTFDHVVPLCRGGHNTIFNAQPLCKPCNSRKGKKSTDYRSLPEFMAFLDKLAADGLL